MATQQTKKKMPRGKPFQKGVDDPRRYNIGIKMQANDMIRSKGPEQAVEMVLDIMTNAKNDRARLEAAKYWRDRGWGKPDGNVSHTVEAGQSFIDALRQINSKPKVDLIEGEVREVHDVTTDVTKTDDEETKA